MTWIWLQKEKPESESETLITAAQINALSSNDIKTNIDNT